MAVAADARRRSRRARARMTRWSGRRTLPSDPPAGRARKTAGGAGGGGAAVAATAAPPRWGGGRRGRRPHHRDGPNRLLLAIGAKGATTAAPAAAAATATGRRIATAVAAAAIAALAAGAGVAVAAPRKQGGERGGQQRDANGDGPGELQCDVAKRSRKMEAERGGNNDEGKGSKTQTVEDSEVVVEAITTTMHRRHRRSLPCPPKSTFLVHNLVRNSIGSR